MNLDAAQFRKALHVLVGLAWIIFGWKAGLPEKWLDGGLFLIGGGLAGQTASDLFGKGKLLAAAAVGAAPRGTHPKPPPAPPVE